MVCLPFFTFVFVNFGTPYRELFAFVEQQTNLRCNGLARDPRFIREFKTKYCIEVFVEHLPTNKKCVCFLSFYPLSKMSSVLTLRIRYEGRNSGDAKTNRRWSIRTKNRFPGLRTHLDYNFVI